MSAATNKEQGHRNAVPAHNIIYDDQTYLRNNPDWHLADCCWKASEICRILERNGVDWRDAAEAGCGSGGIVAELARKFPDRRISGFDISVDAENLWTRHSMPNLSFERTDFIATSKTYDLLLLIDVFEHVPDYMGFLSALSNRAKNFVFHIPLDLHVSGLIRGSHLNARAVVGHLHYFSKSSALATLEDTGYKIDDWAYTAVAANANASTRKLRTRMLNPVRNFAHRIAPDATALMIGGYSLCVLASPRARPNSSKR